MEKNTIEEVIDKLDIFQSRFGKIDQFGWRDLERISADAGTQFTSKEFKNMPNSWSLFDISGTGTSRDERTS